MARIYRPSIVRYVDPETGKRCSKDAPGAVKHKVKSKTWRGEYRDTDGILRTEKLCENKQAAQTMLADRIRQVQSGDPFHLHRNRPLSEHLADFKTHLESKGRTAKHVRSTMTRLKSPFDGCGFRRLAELDTDRVSAWLKDERDADRMAIRTSNYYVAACRQFGAWLVRSRRWPQNPFAHLPKLNADTDDRRERRALSGNELAHLIKSTRGSEDEFRGLSGRDRSILYLTAACTGLRASELASLSESSIDFDAGTLTVNAAYSKRRRKDVLPLHPHLAVKLREWLHTRRETQDGPAVVPMTAKPSDAKLWPGTWKERSARMLRKDLKAARDEWIGKAKTDADRDAREQSEFLQFETAAGVADFHALRHSFITALATSGVHPKDAQTLARHSTITLTMDRYSHISLRDSASALARLPMPSAPSSDVLQATGTDDSENVDSENVVVGMVAGVGAKTCDSVRRNETTGQSERKSETVKKPLKNGCFQGDSEGSGGGTRTPDTRIMIPLL